MGNSPCTKRVHQFSSFVGHVHVTPLCPQSHFHRKRRVPINNRFWRVCQRLLCQLDGARVLVFRTFADLFNPGWGCGGLTGDSNQRRLNHPELGRQRVWYLIFVIFDPGHGELRFARDAACSGTSKRGHLLSPRA